MVRALSGPREPHPYSPFHGGHNVADAFRILLIVGAFWLLMVILRAVREGHRRGQMDRYQVMRFVGVAGLAATFALASAQRGFGAPLNGFLLSAIIFTGIEAVGVLGIRRLQRRNPPPKE